MGEGIGEEVFTSMPFCILILLKISSSCQPCKAWSSFLSRYQFFGVVSENHPQWSCPRFVPRVCYGCMLTQLHMLYQKQLLTCKVSILNLDKYILQKGDQFLVMFVFLYPSTLVEITSMLFSA